MTTRELPELCRTRFAGVVTTAELTAAGLTEARIKGLTRRGVLEPLGRGTYADARRAANAVSQDPARERLLYAAAAVALAGPGVVASHEDAAIAHGLTLLERPPRGRYSITKPPAARLGRSGREAVHVHTASLPRSHVTLREGLPVTTVARTVVDLARTSLFQCGVVVADLALHEFLTKEDLEIVLGDCAGWPGIRRAREVVEFSDPLAESAFESISRVAFRDGGLPRPMLQVWIQVGDNTIGRVDFLWQQRATIAEADGAMKYADPHRARLQLRRDAELRRAGYEVVHFTWHELITAPERVIGSIKAAFGRAARLRA